MTWIGLPSLTVPTANIYKLLGQPNGIASLDSEGKVPVDQVYFQVLNFKGGWNASTNTPHLQNGTGTSGDVYIVTVAGTQNLGSGNITFNQNDFVAYNGEIWAKSQTTLVFSVNGKVGTVVLTTDDIAEGSQLYFTNARAIASILTGYAVGSNTGIADTDTVLQAFGKTQGQLNNKVDNTYGTINYPIVNEGFRPSSPSVGNMLFSSDDPSGAITIINKFDQYIRLQNEIGRVVIDTWRTTDGSTSAVLSGLSNQSPGFTGGYAAKSSSNTNICTALRGIFINTSTVANVTMGVVGNTFTGGYFISRGFKFTQFFYVNNSVATSQRFFGLSAYVTGATLIGANPSTYLNCIGIGHDSNQTTLRLIYANGSTTTTVDLGANFPANTVATDLYLLEIYCPGNGTVIVCVTRENTSQRYYTTLTGADTIPTVGVTTLMTTGNGATAASASSGCSIPVVQTFPALNY